LRQLANDILKAQKENNPSRAQELLDTLVLPNFRQWYAEKFTDVAASRVVPAYAASGPGLPTQLAGVFLGAYKEGFKNVEVIRYVDDRDACLKSSAKVFSGLTARKTSVPLYELRFTHGDRYKSLFAFAYVDGAFRIVLTPDYSSSPDQTATQPGKSPIKIPAGAFVQAARIVCRVPPYYPEEARAQRISGTVRLHAIIGKDGSVKQLEVLSGPSALAEASLQAVRLWRYRPTLLAGEPVEVDTTIDVIFSLNN
jgi:protein TonB